MSKFVSIKIMVKVTRLRSPAAFKENWGGYVGQTAQLTGNAHVGFELVMPDGERICNIHFYYETIKENQCG